MINLKLLSSLVPFLYTKSSKPVVYFTLTASLTVEESHFKCLIALPGLWSSWVAQVYTVGGKGGNRVARSDVLAMVQMRENGEERGGWGQKHLRDERFSRSLRQRVELAESPTPARCREEGEPCWEQLQAWHRASHGRRRLQKETFSSGWAL